MGMFSVCAAIARTSQTVPGLSISHKKWEELIAAGLRRGQHRARYPADGDIH
jgi:hypothetical protein